MVCRTTLLENTYKELNDIGIKIHCIGGASKLQSSIRNYSNLIPLIDSVIEFLGCELIDIWVSDWIQHDLNIDDDFLKLLTELPYPRDTLSKEWFYPDGTHPNRHAHKKIFEYILTC
jgi:hypothetical protein